MSGRASRRKGHDYERDVAALWKQAGWPDARRGYQARDGADAPDGAGGAPYWIECKRGKATSPRAALRQATAAAPATGWIPVAICRDDRDTATVTLALEDFMDIVTSLRELVHR